MDNGPTRALARFSAGLTYDAIPPSVIDHIKLCILDSLGCGLFGSTLTCPRIIADFTHSLGGRQESAVWGHRFRVSAPNAALVNGTAVHSFELDDLHKTSIVHPGGVVIPSALAVAESLDGRSGKEFLTAVVVGYEVAIRIGMSLGTSHLSRGFHPTATHGTFGAGAAAGRILRLDTEKMIHNLGISGTQAAGLMASQYGAMVRQMHVGRASQSGVYGALLAQRGLTGITHILEADYGGYCRTMADTRDMDKLTAGLGEVFEADRVGFKLYAAGGSTHTAHEAVKSIMEKNRLASDMIEKIIIRTTTITFQHTSWEYRAESVPEAQMNMQYVVAVTVLEGSIFIEQFSEEKIKDLKIIEYSRKVEVLPDPDLDRLGPEFRHAVCAEIKTKDGGTFKERVDTAKGSDKKPVTIDEIIRKFNILADKILARKQVAELQDTVLNLEQVSDVKELAGLLVP
jgi:aconitate decarboxylase